MTILRVITNSERSAFACPKLWWLTYEEGLTAMQTAAPLIQGALAHRGIEAWGRSTMGAGEPTTGAELEVEVIEPWVEGRREYALAQDPDTVDVDALLQRDEDIATQTNGMLRGYVKRWEDDVEDWETIAVEPQLARWLVHPEHGGPVVDMPKLRGAMRVRRRWAYGGSIDRVARRRHDGAVWFFETKTTIETDLEAYARKLHFDPQIRGYGWALGDPIPEYSDPALEGGFEIAGVMYDVLRKAVPREPNVLSKCGACGHPRSKHPEPGAFDPECLGSKACACVRWTPGSLERRDDMVTTRDLYLATIVKHGLNPDDYAEILERLPDGSSFFKRVPYALTGPELDDFGLDAAWSALSIVEESRRPHHTRQVRVCQGVASTGCPRRLESVCMEDGPMTRRSFNVLGIRHPELVGELAEPWVGPARGVDAATDDAGFHEKRNEVTDGDWGDDPFAELGG